MAELRHMFLMYFKRNNKCLIRKGGRILCHKGLGFVCYSLYVSAVTNHYALLKGKQRCLPLCEPALISVDCQPWDYATSRAYTFICFICGVMCSQHYLFIVCWGYWSRFMFANPFFRLYWRDLWLKMHAHRGQEPSSVCHHVMFCF